VKENNSKTKEKALFDLPIEGAVIGTILNDTSFLFLVEPFLSSDDFSFGNSSLYGVIQKIIHSGEYKKLDPITVISYAKEINNSEVEKKHDYIEALLCRKLDADNFKEMAIRIKRLSLKRTLKETLKDTESGIVDDGETVLNVLNHIESEIFKFGSILSGEKKINKLGEGAIEFANEKADNPVSSIGFETDFSIYTDAVGGLFRRSTVNLLMGRAKSGKSFMALNLAFDQAKRGIPVLYIDSELKKEDQMVRLLSIASGVPTKYIETGKWRGDKGLKNRVYEGNELIKNMPLFFVSTIGEEIEVALSHIRDFLNRTVQRDKKCKYRDCVVFYDYFKITSESEITDNIQEYQRIGFMMQKFRDMALLYDFPMVIAVQSNRSGLTDFTEGSISQSDRLNWLATSLAIFARKTGDEIDEFGDHLGTRKMYIPYSHHGEGLKPGDFIHLNDDLSCGRVAEIKLNSNVQSNIHKKRDRETGKVKKEIKDRIKNLK